MEDNIHVCCMAIHSFGTQTQAHGTEPKPKATLAPRMVVFNDSRQPKAPSQGNVDALSWSLTA